MELNEYQEKAMATCLPESRNYSYMFQGLVEEVGELSGKISKAIRKGMAEINYNLLCIGDSPELKDSIKKELGDVAWMLAGLCEVLGYKLEDICQCNLDKLASRAKRGVINGEGDNR